MMTHHDSSCMTHHDSWVLRKPLTLTQCSLLFQDRRWLKQLSHSDELEQDLVSCRKELNHVIPRKYRHYWTETPSKPKSNETEADLLESKSRMQVFTDWLLDSHLFGMMRLKNDPLYAEAWLEKIEAQEAELKEIKRQFILFDWPKCDIDMYHENREILPETLEAKKLLELQPRLISLVQRIKKWNRQAAEIGVVRQQLRQVFPPLVYKYPKYPENINSKSLANLITRIKGCVEEETEMLNMELKLTSLVAMVDFNLDSRKVKISSTKDAIQQLANTAEVVYGKYLDEKWLADHHYHLGRKFYLFLFHWLELF